jgi:Na+:H+ antiporter, NhaA family
MIPSISKKAVETLRDFLKLESAGGMLLIAATVLALLVANIPFTEALYRWALNLHLTITLGGLGIDKPLLLWINDALMALFFLLVGLELKREMVEGQLSSAEQVVLPALAALGGIVAPAALYWWLNAGVEVQQRGWAIPTATDIAFALAILGLMGSRVPVALKVFLTTIAIVDDIAAICLIALFYTSELSATALLYAGAGIVGLFLLNYWRVVRIAPYLLIGLFIWFCVLKSGVHATLAGVVVAAFIPMRSVNAESPVRQLEHVLHPWVAFAILPIFAFANAGVSFAGLTREAVTGGVPGGIVLGLFAGKQIGVFGMVALAWLLRLAKLPTGTTWGQIYGVAVLCGVGFTMSLFIGSLAFGEENPGLISAVRLGVIAGSVLSAIFGLVILNFTLPRKAQPGKTPPE